MHREIYILLVCFLVSLQCFPDSTSSLVTGSTTTIIRTSKPTASSSASSTTPSSPSTTPSSPSTTTSAPSTVSTATSEEDTSTETTKNNGPVLPKIYEMRVDTNISNRFARTQVTSKVKNLNKEAQEAIFSVVIPDQAYISGFTMEIDGKSYEAYVQEKEEAKTTYDRAVASGQAAAHVAVNARDSNRFSVSVNIEPQSKAVFYLRYEELLTRQNDKYELVINIHPGQPVKKLDVEVHIDESRPLKFVKALPLRTGNEISKDNEKLKTNADVTNINKTSAVIKFSPDVEKQKQYATALGTELNNGIAGQFIIQYDVEKDPQGGEVLVDGGYFVHFFAPTDQEALPKQVVFVLDTSGSMEGIRIQQLKEAMRSILSELKDVDVFNIVEFGSVVKVWNVDRVAVQYQSAMDSWRFQEEDPEEPFKNKTAQPLPPAFKASEGNIKKAMDVVGKLNAFGGTDIESALKIAIQLIEKHQQEDKTHQPLVVFLTDGEPTVGEVNTATITKTISQLNTDETPIFSLSFGDGADRSFLQKLSLKNFGFARHIYEAADASLQLEEFYKQISSPLLSNVTFQYVSNVSEVTRVQFPILFHGSELVVAGQIDPGFAPPRVHGWGINGPVELQSVVENSVGSLERLWAYLTLQQILEQRDAADDKSGPTQEALRIALKYSFVSDVTSLVVVKPNASSAVETEDASDKGNGYPILSSGGGVGAFDSYHNYIGGSSGYSGGGGFGLGSGYSSGGGFGGASGYSGSPASYQFIARPQVASFHYATTNRGPAPLEPVVESDLLLEDVATTPSEDFSSFIFTTPETVDEELSYLKSKLPWLSSILNDNGTVSVNSGIYELGLNETIKDNPKCSNSPTGDTGKCVLINKCPQLYTQVTSVDTYKKYFCALERFAGICCPVIEQTKSS